MSKKFLLLVLLVVIASFTIGCVNKNTSSDVIPTPTIDHTIDSRNMNSYDQITIEYGNTFISPNNDYISVTVIHYNAKKVTCFVSNGYRSGGISCLPDSEIVR